MVAPKQGNTTMDERLFTPTQLNDFLATVTDQRNRAIASAPDLLQEWCASGRADIYHRRNLARLRTRLETPMAARLEQDLLHWLSSDLSEDDLIPWCEVALSWLRLGEFHAAMSVLWLMKEHLTFVPADLDAEEDGWADYTPRRADGPSEVVRQLALKCVTAHPLYRTQEEIRVAQEAEFEEAMEAVQNAPADRTTAEMMADCNATIGAILEDL